jgi:hypothetical protein
VEWRRAFGGEINLWGLVSRSFWFVSGVVLDLITWTTEWTREHDSLVQPRDRRPSHAREQERVRSPMTLATTPVSAATEEQHENYDNQDHFHGSLR